MLLRLYRRARRLRDSTFRLVAATFDGFWLGLFDRDDLARLDEGYYDHRIGGYVDAEYNLAGLFDWERELVEPSFRPGGKVIVTGAGAGREVIGLLDLGFDAIGYEPHPRLVEAANGLLGGRGDGERVHVVARDAFPSTADRRFDGVLVGWGSYMLIPGRDRRVAFLRAARQVLDAGDHVVVTFFTRDPRDPRFSRVWKVARVVRWLRRAEPVQLGDALAPNYAHHFTEETIREELRQAGFELVSYDDDGYGKAVGRAVQP